MTQKKAGLSAFLQSEYSRVTDNVAAEICKAAQLSPRQLASGLNRGEVEKLYSTIQATKLLPPPTNCLSPMGEESLLKALYWLFVESQRWDLEEQSLAMSEEAPTPPPAKKGKAKAQGEFDFAAKKSEEQASTPAQPLAKVQTLKGDTEGSVHSPEGNYFVTAVTRPPAVYRGNPFQVEVGLFYGKGLKADGLMQLYRYANRVPLQYQAAACAMTKSVISAPWRSYGLEQAKGGLPVGPVVIVTHIASVWVPYTSESKEAIAHYPEIIKEFRLALLECGRRLQRFLKHRRREADEAKKRSYIQKYLNPIGEALQEILGLPERERDATVEKLEEILEKEPRKNSAGKRSRTASI